MIRTLFDNHWNRAKKLFKKDSAEIVEHGWEQHVILDHNKRLVYRYPRNQNASNKLVDEIDLLKDLNRQNWPVQIPKMLDHTKDYSVYELIEGDVLSPDRIATLKDAEMAEIGKDLGIFLARLHQTDKSLVDRKKTKQTMSLYEYYRQRIYKAKDSKFYEQACKDLSQLSGDVNKHDQVVVHGDLHGLNMVVSPTTNKLVGVIDFSELEIGDPHQDFRKLFMADERLLSPAVKSYHRAGGPKLSEDIIKHWAYVNEWANVCFFDKKPDNPTYKRAYNHLKKWGRI